LLFRSELPDREHRQRPLHRDEGSDARVAGLQFHAGEAVGGGRGAGAAVALAMHAVHAELSERLCPVGGGDGPLLPPLADVRGDLLLREVPDRVPEQHLLLAEEGVYVEEIVRVGPDEGNLTHDGGWYPVSRPESSPPDRPGRREASP